MVKVSPHQMHIGNRLVKQVLTENLKINGHVSIDPSGVWLQLNDLTRSPISPVFCWIASALDLNFASVGTLVSRARLAFRKEYTKLYGEPRIEK